MLTYEMRRSAVFSPNKKDIFDSTREKNDRTRSRASVSEISLIFWTLLRRLRRSSSPIPKQPRPLLVRLVRGRRLGLLALVEAGPDVLPVTLGRRLRVFRRAGFVEVGVLEAVEQRGE